VIDFKSKPRHEMDILAAADLLERLPEDDLRVMAAYRRDDLRLAAKGSPLAVLKKALARLGNDAPLRHVKDMLVPDAVEKTAWAGWWREAKKAALLDPSVRIVGTGPDPRLSITDVAGSDFRSVVERQVAFAKDSVAKQGILREFAKTTAGDAGARGLLAEVARAEWLRVPEADAPLRLSWALVLADLEGSDPTSSMAPSFAAAADPETVLRGIPDDSIRALAGRACLVGRPADGPELLLKLALEQDIALADIAADHYLAAKRPELLDRLLNPVFDDPESRPLLYQWAMRGLVRSRWPGRAADPYRVAEQVIKVLDATAYRAKRAGRPHDARAVDALADLLGDKNCRIVAEAAAAGDLDGARHLLRLLRRNQGLKPRLQEKLTDTILRAHPTALREEGEPEGPAAAPRSAEIYMTAAGIEKLKREYERLVHEEMPANQAEIARAREFGDLSENAEYHAAREKQGMLLARENDLKNQISLAREIRPEIVRTDAVSVGSRVRLKDDAGTEITYSLLGPSDVDMTRNVINYKTPLGQSLMGKKAGEVVVLELMGARHVYHVLEIGSAL
jgi:transcription elongation factor GreA